MLSKEALDRVLASYPEERQKITESAQMEVLRARRMRAPRDKVKSALHQFLKVHVQMSYFC